MFDRQFVVLEIANILAGPITSMMFAELGARVIKVENPATDGDATRGWKLGSEPEDSDVSSYFACANWGKESIACDVRNAAGREVVHDLAARADIVIASFKPGDEVKLGLDYASLKHRNSKLIYGHISAYGEDDPRPGFDAILQAESGFTYLNGEADGPPTKMPVALIDLLLAHQLKEGLLLALLKRERSGEGSVVKTSLIEAGVSSLANQATNYLVGGQIPKRMGSEHPNIVPYGSILPCADDRELVIAAATERQYRELMSALDLGEIAEDPRFVSGQKRVQNRESLLQLIREAAARINSSDLAGRLETRKIPFGYVNDMAAVFAQPGAQNLVLRGEQQGRELRGVRSLAIGGNAVDLGTPGVPPRFNQHRDEILSNFLGYSNARIAALEDDGSIV